MSIRSLMLSPLSLLWHVIMQARLMAYKKGLLGRQRLQRPLVCVGNLTLGGTGKTPLTLMVARRLNAMGKKVAIISRGYGRKRPLPEPVVVSDGQGLMASLEDSGDEPLMMARQAPEIPIVVCADRYRAGVLAIERFQCDILVMDDGYQRLGLRRDLDLLVFDGATALHAMRLFPAGRLREPLRNMNRAQACIVSRSNLCGDADGRAREIRAIQPEMPVLMARLKPRMVYRLGDRSQTIPMASLQGKRVVLVSALGHPEGFEALARQELAVEIVGSVIFRDHHGYGLADVEQVEGARNKLDAQYIITTEKDAIKLHAHTAASQWLVVAVEACLNNQIDKDLFNRLLMSL